MRTTSLEVRDRGQAILPKALRDALQLEEGDAVRAVQTDRRFHRIDTAAPGAGRPAQGSSASDEKAQRHRG